MSKKVDVSVIIPVKNGGEFLEETLNAILNQTAIENGLILEICIFDDGSTDETWEIIENFALQLKSSKILLKKSRSFTSGGVGFAKNRAIQLSSGEFLCFNDADDVSSPNRIEAQWRCGQRRLESSEFVFIGGNFRRIPEDSTKRYTKWANSLRCDELTRQVFTSHGPTIVAPTWFLNRKLYEFVGKFNEEQKSGFPEDLEFFYRCLDVPSCQFDKIPAEIVTYRYHPGCATFGVDEKSIWNLRFNRLRDEYLSKWPKFTIWSAGKQGKRFFKCLSEDEKLKVAMFCDVDVSKIKRGVHEEYDEIARKVTHRIPIVEVGNAIPPLIVCVKLDMTNGDLENLITNHRWKEEEHLIYFG